MIDLFQPGAYARAAGGNQEVPQFQKQAVKWISWSINADNGGGGGTAVWDKARGLWAANGIADFPWMHVRKMDDLEWLIQVGEGKNSPAIGFNVENIVADGISLQEMGGYLLDFWVNRYEKPVHMPTLAWVQNGQGWQYVSFANCALEIFTDEQVIWPNHQFDQKILEDCIDHAHAEGLPTVSLMLKTKGYTPSSYGQSFSICHSLYTSDDIAPTAPAWNTWVQTQPCDRLVVKPDVPLPPAVVPYTGPYYGPSNPKGPMKGPTAKALKRAMIRLGLMDGALTSLDEHYNLKLETAMKRFQTQEGLQRSGQYGSASWVEIRAAKVPHGPHRGEYALDEAAQKLIRDEWLKDQIKLCYPVPLGEFSVICQGLHETGGLAGNWAIDFCGPTGTDIMAVEDAEITKLSGKDPDSDIPDPTGTFGWSVHYRTSSGYRYFLTHLGRREALSVGQKVLMGTVLGKIGDQEFRPDHLHLGVTSPTSEADARKKIEDVSKAPMIPEL